MYVCSASRLFFTAKGRMSPGLSRESMRDRGPGMVSLAGARGLGICLPSTLSCVLRSHTGRVLRQGPALRRILVVVACPNALRDIRRIASCPNLGISPLPVMRQSLSRGRIIALTGHRVNVGVPSFLKILCNKARSLPSSPESNNVG